VKKYSRDNVWTVDKLMLLLQGQAGQKGYKGDTGLPGYDAVPAAKVNILL